MFKDVDIFLAKMVFFWEKDVAFGHLTCGFSYEHIKKNYVILVWLIYFEIESRDVVVFLMNKLFIFGWI